MKELVKQEADNIRKFATKEEIDLLDFETLNPSSGSLCIYGQMTGDCYNPRALELLNKCSKPYSYSLLYPVKSAVSFFTESYPRDFSPIEFEIVNNPEGNKELIEYIKA